MTAPTDDLAARALEECAREPIRTPGSVQSHGALVGLVEPGLEVVVASANTASILGVGPDGLLGSTLATALGVDAAEAVASAARQNLDAVNPLVLELEGAPTTASELILHRAGGLLLVEVEPIETAEGADLSYRALRQPVRRLHQCRSIDEIARTTAREIRALTGFDRVMVYRFDREWNGEVIAEERRPDMEPFLGLRYPASDIPPQARELYRTSWLRLIADVDAPTSPLVPDHHPLDGGPLDLTSAALRSVSPVHLMYLRNMGVRASMSISLLDRGELWGLVACHHETPHRPSYGVRSAAELIGQTVSALLATMEVEGGHEDELATNHALTRAIQLSSVTAGDLTELLLDDVEPLLTLAGATGVALRLGYQIRTAGMAPDAAVADDIASAMWAERSAGVVHTEHLAGIDDAFLPVHDVASGAIGVRVCDRDDRWILWFRGEELQHVEWGGDPNAGKIDLRDDGSPQLSPRRSFARWSETVRHRSLPWTASQVGAVRTFGSHLTDVVRRRDQQEADLAATLQRMLLLEELPQIAGLGVEVRYEPAADDPVGGDWYDLFYLSEDRVGITLGDVAGHGVQAAGIMAQLRHGLRAYMVREPSPAAALRRLNDLTLHLLPRELATVVVADFEPASGRLRVANAGHLPPLVVPGDGSAPRFMDEHLGPALGPMPDAHFGQTVITLAAGDTLLLYTDGLVERRGESLDRGLQRLRAAAADDPTPDAIFGKLIDGGNADDVTLLSVRADRGASRP